MIIKTIGAILIIAACGCFGFLTTASHRRSAKLMRQLLSAIDNISQELRYRMCSLPDAFHNTAQYYSGTIGAFFNTLANELEKQVASDIIYCVDAALAQTRDVPDIVKRGLLLLGKVSGRFDLEGQLKGLDAVHEECSSILEAFIDNQDIRLRSYQTLALCAGAAIVILFI